MHPGNDGQRTVPEDTSVGSDRSGLAKLDEGMTYIPDQTTENGEPLPVPISKRL
jgi:hypothetical protein